MTTYIAYGNGDKRKGLGFPELSDFLAYIREDVFTHNRSRYRYVQNRDADVIVLTRDALAVGHFVIERSEKPNYEDLADYPDTTCVYIVKESARYTNPVRIFDFGIRNNQSGVVFDKDTFDLICNAAGGVEVFPRIETRYCRLCYNTDHWWKPSGAAIEGDTYYSANGFGHEEWLFRYEWCIKGHKYGFLQPVSRHHKNNQGKTFSLILTTTHLGKTLFAGVIRKVYIPLDDELKDAYAQFEANGWLDEMRKETKVVRGRVEALGDNPPNQMLNVRFDPADVVLNDQMPVFPDGQKPTRAPYYNLYEDEGEPLPILVENATNAKLSIAYRKELQYQRAAQQCTTVNPVHAKLQNRLYEWLCDQHGAGAIGFEVDDVDLRMTLPSEVTFFEIKTNSTVRRCIRDALGQLFDYSSYPAVPKADKWVVVGAETATSEDIAYLSHLRSKYGLPIYYRKFDWNTNSLGDAT